MAPIGQLCRSVVSGVTIEPMFVLYFVTAALSGFAGNNLLIQKACHPDLTVEPDYAVPCPDEANAQKVVTGINIWKPACESLIPLFFVIFLGTWSDTHGRRRKPLLFIPLVGEIVRSVACMVCVYYWQISPITTALIEALLRGISGGGICFMFGANTYISDITSVEDRTVRLGIINALAFIGSPVGIMLGGVIRTKLGFFNLFGMCLAGNVMSLILGVLLMKNTACVESKLKTFEGVCDPSHFILSVKTVLKKRPGKERLILLLMAAVAPIYLACFIGEYTVLYFFARYKFNMDEVEFGNYCAYKMITIFFGSFISLVICSKILKMSDAMIGCLGTLSQIASAVGLCFSEHRWQLYFFPIVDLMHGAAGTASRSIISKTIDKSELGQVFSVIGAVDVVAPLVVLPLYNLLYKYTFSFMPGAFYLFSVFLAFIYLTLFFSVYLLEKPQTKLEKEKVDVKSEKDKCVDVPLI